MSIDPLEAIIKWLTTALTTAGGRVAGKHRYGDNWTETQAGVSVHLDGGLPDIYAKVAVPRLEIRIYADDQAKVSPVYLQLKDLSRNNQRFTQSTTNGTALIQYFLPLTGLSFIYDDVLKKDVGIVFFESMISEEVIA